MASTEQATGAQIFDAQVDTLLRKGYPTLAGMRAEELVGALEPLRDRAAALDIETDGHIPFVVVIGAELMPAAHAVTMVELDGRPGFTDMEAADAASFEPLPSIRLPDEPAYLITDIDPGEALRDVTPDDALPRITDAGRSPLTLEEGIALATHHPEVLRERTCYSMLGSRSGDRRVTALWISRNQPRLGWCWAGNPHTWLGSASCGGRLG
jgi:Family of unknown function (DUF5701)